MSKTTLEIINLTYGYYTKNRNCMPPITSAYIQYMFDKMKEFDDENKLNRWVGFIQGVMVGEDVIKIEELRDMCREEN
jgi:hypothetical protein